MHKLGLPIINKMINRKCTSSEIDFVLYLSRFQNSLGQVRNIYYKDACMALDIAKQTFYNLLQSLEIKGVIKVSYQNKVTWDIILLDNAFVNDKDFKKGYINTNRDFLFTSEFRDLRPNAKILMLRLIRNFREQQSIKLKVKTLFEWVGTTNKSLLFSYLRDIMAWVDMSYKNGSSIIRFKSNYSFNKASDTGTRVSFINNLVNWLNSKKICYTNKDLTDLHTLYNQYKDKWGIFVGALSDSISHFKSLEPANINNLINLRIQN